RPMRLQQAANHVDGGVMAVEQRRGTHEAQRVRLGAGRTVVGTERQNSGGIHTGASRLIRADRLHSRETPCSAGALIYPRVYLAGPRPVNVGPGRYPRSHVHGRPTRAHVMIVALPYSGAAFRWQVDKRARTLHNEPVGRPCGPRLVRAYAIASASGTRSS